MDVLAREDLPFPQSLPEFQVNNLRETKIADRVKAQRLDIARRANMRAAEKIYKAKQEKALGVDGRKAERGRGLAMDL